MTTETYTDDEIEVRVDWSDAASSVDWRMHPRYWGIDEETGEVWNRTQYQTANVRGMDPDEIVTLVSEWVG